MNTLARYILETYLFENKKVVVKDIADKLSLRGKLPVFVTVYDGDVIVGSCGRIYPIEEDIGSELIANTLTMIEDPRFAPYKDNHEKARKLSYRIDTFTEKDRRLLHHPDELNATEEGMVLLCQKQEKAGIILPHISKAISGETVYHELAQKIGLDTEHLGKWDIILYGVKTQVFQDAR